MPTEEVFASTRPCLAHFNRGCAGARPRCAFQVSSTAVSLKPGARDACHANGDFPSLEILAMPTTLRRSRSLAFQQQAGRCFYCGVMMWLRHPSELPGPLPRSKAAERIRCTAEHLTPRSEGGRDTLDNIVAACAHCNHTRHKRKKPPEWTAYRLDVLRRTQRGAWHHLWVYEFGLIDPEGRRRRMGVEAVRVAHSTHPHGLDIARPKAKGARPCDLTPCVSWLPDLGSNQGPTD